MILDQVYFTDFRLATVRIERNGIMLYAIIKLVRNKIAVLRTCYSEAGAGGMLNDEVRRELNKERDDKELSWTESTLADPLEDRCIKDVLDSFSIRCN